MSDTKWHPGIIYQYDVVEPPPTDLVACPLCGAVVMIAATPTPNGEYISGIQRHARWHEAMEKGND